jgi:succinate dehydrogenase / fumarate reductase flavoprotein subunit
VAAEAEKTADACLGVRRSFSDLSAGLRTATGLIEEHLPRLEVSFPGRRYNLEWMQALQLENRLVCLEASIRSALERSESRGQHLRIDHPGVDNTRGLCRHHLIRRNGTLALEKKPPGFDHLSPPPENFAGVIEYALFCRRHEQKGNRWRWW